MNNPFVVQQAERWAKRVLSEPACGHRERIIRMYLSAFGRPPTTEEIAEDLGARDKRRARHGSQIGDVGGKWARDELSLADEVRHRQRL